MIPAGYFEDVYKAIAERAHRQAQAKARGLQAIAEAPPRII